MEIKLTKIIEVMERGNKPVWLFAILKMDEYVDKWSIIISAPWINNNNRAEMFGYIINLFKKMLDEKESLSIGRVGLLPKEDHLVSELLKKNTGESLKNVQVNGNIVHEGTIIASNLDLIWPDKSSSEVTGTGM